MHPVTYRGALVALAGRHHFALAPAIAARPDGDPLKRFVAYLCLYAREAEHFQPLEAERFARAALIDDDELARELRALDRRLAARFRVPVEQLTARRRELDGKYESSAAVNPRCRRQRRPAGSG